MYSLMDDKKLNQNLKTGKLADAKKELKYFNLWIEK